MAKTVEDFENLVAFLRAAPEDSLAALAEFWDAVDEIQRRDGLPPEASGARDRVLSTLAAAALDFSRIDQRTGVFAATLLMPVGVTPSLRNGALWDKYLPRGLDVLLPHLLNLPQEVRLTTSRQIAGVRELLAATPAVLHRHRVALASGCRAALHALGPAPRTPSSPARSGPFSRMRMPGNVRPLGLIAIVVTGPWEAICSGIIWEPSPHFLDDVEDLLSAWAGRRAAVDPALLVRPSQACLPARSPQPAS